MNRDIDLVPYPASLIESLRNIGYSLETAIADIIDNSITAGAREIKIRFAWNSGSPWLGIIDNGSGMTKNELISAMRFGSMNPLETRAEKDLGRFGLGMKTASFSQCRHLTVLSKQGDQISCYEWDLEKLSRSDNSGWKLGFLDEKEILRRKELTKIYNEALSHSDSGTIVYWAELDRIIDQVSSSKQESHLNALIDDTRKHLELVFHRYLSPGPGKKKITITVNGDELEAYSPFNIRNRATQELPEQKIMLEGETIVVRPYVLPHNNKVSRQEYQQYSGEGGYLHNQGFYVYRNRRLIIKGTWFRLIKKIELNKLIRVMIDIPNSLDYLWKIDVKKSAASPPEIIKKELKQVISRIERSGQLVYRQRGRKLSTNINYPVWNRIVSAGTISYHINREHPLVERLLDIIPTEQKALLGNLIMMFESSFPVDLFFNDIASKPEQVENPAFKEKDLEVLLEFFIQNWISAGIPEGELLEKLLSTDPFASNRDLAQRILNRKGYKNEQ